MGVALSLISGMHKSLIKNLTEKPLSFASTSRNVSYATPRNLNSFCPFPLPRNVSETSAFCTSQTTPAFAPASLPEDSPLSGLEDALASYVFGKKKATEVAHKVWERVVRKGDTVIDATCGNGYDTLKMLRMVADESQQGRVYGLDIQNDALENTSSLLEQSVSPNEKELVKLFQICHSKMGEVLPEDTWMGLGSDFLGDFRLIAFNLGYLPGGDKTLITEPHTTLEALNVAKNILTPGGLISLVVYIGHPGGWQEWETVQEFSSKLSLEKWICCKLQMINRPMSPILIFLFKKC
ncbi:S-adenosyl-L-methionine-dependent methyltransferase superfamily protein [Parasponia andersonii]|uniref:S-adenosyl-L-methionine-dependent methyltransferase superfamily protein n=1 Tax=Parasponia andersonii TaxID=3476 RepID=A0A2P5DAH8_PARAD|nr:S-adenosyl-L-methionine-dependent methyltransferase superfamily protein [Parasponia andersonii]